MDHRPPQILSALAVDAPASEGARGFLDVLLAVTAFAEREKLHHLAGKILVRLPFAVGCRIQIEDHRRVLGDGMQQLTEIAQRMAPQQQVLFQHQAAEFDFLLTRNKMVVPEERHALGQWRWCLQHFLQPPAAQFGAFLELGP